jgi:hypothetical protein
MEGTSCASSLVTARASRDVGARERRAAGIEALCELSRVVATSVLLGDTPLRVASASGRREWPRERRSIGATSHLRMLNDPAVYAQLRDWLRRRVTPMAHPH